MFIKTDVMFLKQKNKSELIIEHIENHPDLSLGALLRLAKTAIYHRTGSL